MARRAEWARGREVLMRALLRSNCVEIIVASLQSYIVWEVGGGGVEACGVGGILTKQSSDILQLSQC